MAKTLQDVTTDASRRLGDTSATLWTTGELSEYAREGYNVICLQAKLILETQYLEDHGGNVTADWERDFLEGGMLFTGIMTHTARFERDFLEDGQHFYIANYNHPWEAAYVSTDVLRAVHDLPDDHLELERAVWDTKRIQPLDPAKIEVHDSRYEETEGEVEAYLINKDGLNRFRKWRVPSDEADEYTVTGTFGCLRNPDDISGEEVIGTWGLPRRIPGMHMMYGGFGLPRRPFKEVRNTRIEYYRRGERPWREDSRFEIPDRYVKYVLWFVLGRALNREGDGQDRKAGAHWMERFQLGVARILKRKGRISDHRIRSLEHGNTTRGRPPLAKLPWQYGKPVGYPPGI